MEKYKAAQEQYEKALDIYRAIGNRLEKAKSLQSLKNVSLLLRGVGLGQVPYLSERARRRYKKAPGICRAIGNWRGVNNCSSGLCGVHMQLGVTERHRPTHPARERKRGNTRKHQEKTLSKKCRVINKKAQDVGILGTLVTISGLPEEMGAAAASGGAGKVFR